LSKSNILQFLLRRKPGKQGTDDLKSSNPERRAQALFRIGRTKMRSGDIIEAIEIFDQAIALLPDYAEAVAARAESLDLLGRSAAAAPEYEKARRLWADQHTGAPDRSYLFRQHGRFTFEVDSYELALLRIKTGAFPHLACGNALLAQGRAEEALECYERALKLKRNNPDLIALKGEALSMLGRYGEAIEAFNVALVAISKSPENFSARAIALAALGRMAEADLDWRRQLELLDAGQYAARAYVALRLADYEVALGEIDRAQARAPADLYWQLYRITALRRLDRPVSSIELPTQDAWPAPLLALHAGKATPEEVLNRASTRGRRTEALFQLAVLAAPDDPRSAEKCWKETIDQAIPALLEYAAARNELSRQNS
jgi:tetratricopeptide (TPR) repeat protein